MSARKSGFKHYVRKHWNKRLILPLFRSRRPPDYSARGASVGLVIALTPTVGIQMFTVLVIWAVIKAVAPRYSFSVIAGMAWTWITNIFTLGPFYFIFYVTGVFLMGRWEEVTSYGVFERRLFDALETQGGWLEGTWLKLVNLFEMFGVPMLVGSIPWAILGGWLGFVWVHRLIVRIKTQREAKRKKRRAARRKITGKGAPKGGTKSGAAAEGSTS